MAINHGLVYAFVLVIELELDLNVSSVVELF
jgi:hypothetical protein